MEFFEQVANPGQACTTGLICAKCGETTKVSNWKVAITEKTLEIVGSFGQLFMNFTCSHCKETYQLAKFEQKL